MQKEELLYDHYKDTSQILANNIVKRNRLFIYLAILILLISFPDFSEEIKNALFAKYTGEDVHSSRSIDARYVFRSVLYMVFAGVFFYFGFINVACKRLTEYLGDIEVELSLCGDFFLDREGKGKNSTYNKYMDHLQFTFTTIFSIIVILFFCWALYWDWVMLYRNWPILSQDGYIKLVYWLIELIAVLSICVIAFFIIYVKETIDQRRLQKITGIPVIESIPETKEDIYYTFNPIYTENIDIFCNIRIHIDKLFLEDKNNAHIIILVTSNKYGEGKTMLSHCLAMCIADSQQKVLVCDMNLRKITRKSLSSKGLTSYLYEHESTDIHEYIESDEEKFHILRSGLIPPNPIDTLRKEKLDNLIKQLKDEYNYIIIDSSPLLVSDTLLLKDYADVTLLACHQRKISQNDIRKMVFYQRKKEFHNLHIILNHTKKNRIYTYSRI